MRTTLRKIGNSRGVLIPAALLAQVEITDEIELRLEGARIIIEPVKPSREGWFDGYRPEEDEDAWPETELDTDHDEWQW
ncbi:AbrB/MazE/SpoVT family DNA-binding domain-containing protein [Thioalkalivibrio sp.]|uniref:AbrB/MazE/SpoVT family DNA-binding domain-containing protein n=1 Tax=Thioalkalivibrio sp. TaxID=2093813 RepID=UPI0039771000